MGYGDYSYEAHVAVTQSRATSSASEVFRSSACHPTLDPLGVKVREARDSKAHPDSVGVIFALDVSGSMGAVPVGLATKTLPGFMNEVRRYLPDIQLCFMALGNAFTDRSPLQVGQFESEAGLMDQWLSRLHLEGRGGGLGESYDLAIYFAAHHTAMDCVQKRGRKGYLFLTGDEPPFAALDAGLVKKVIGDGQPVETDIYQVVEAAQKSFHVFFLIPDAVRAKQHDVGFVWDNILHERAVVLDRPEDTAAVCALLVGITERKLVGIEAVKAAVAGQDGADRWVAAVARYAEAWPKGEMAAPTRMGTRKDPGVQG